LVDSHPVVKKQTRDRVDAVLVLAVGFELDDALYLLRRECGKHVLRPFQSRYTNQLRQVSFCVRPTKERLYRADIADTPLIVCPLLPLNARKLFRYHTAVLGATFLKYVRSWINRSTSACCDSRVLMDNVDVAPM